MKIKDLLRFNPEAELKLLGMNYTPIELSIYGWSYCGDSSENTNNDKDTAEVLVIPKGLENKYKTKVEA